MTVPEAILTCAAAQDEQIAVGDDTASGAQVEVKGRLIAGGQTADGERADRTDPARRDRMRPGTGDDITGDRADRPARQRAAVEGDVAGTGCGARGVGNDQRSVVQVRAAGVIARSAECPAARSDLNDFA